MISKFLDPKNDFAFRQVFGQAKNKDILIHFLNDVLDHTHIGQIVGVQFLERVRDPEIAAKKQSIVDIRCTDQKGREYIIEMQVAKQPGFEKRAQYYAAKAYSRQLMPADQYEQLKEVIFIAITDYIVFPKKSAFKSDHIILDQKTQEHDLKDLYFTFIELPKFSKGSSELACGLDYWCYYFKHAPQTPPEDYERLIAHSAIIQRAYQALDQYYWSEAELNTYESWLKAERDSQGIERQKLLDAEARGIEKGIEKGIEEGIEIGKEKGIEIGKEKGREEGIEVGAEQRNIAIAQSMLSDGESLEKIQKWTGLSLEQINALQ